MHRHHWHPRRRRRHGIGAWGELRRGRFFAAGEVRLALLSLLSEGPRHGYELMKELEARSGGVYRASAGTIYPTLAQLEDEERVTSERRQGKRVYALTEAGRAELDAESQTVDRIWRRADDWGEWEAAAAPETWEIARPALRVVKLAMRAVARRGADEARIDRVREILAETAARLQALGREG